MEIIQTKPLGQTGTQFRFSDGHIVNLYYGKEGTRFVHGGRRGAHPVSDYETAIRTHVPDRFPSVAWESYDSFNHKNRNG